MSITDGPLAAYRPTLRRRRGLTSRRYTAVLVLGDYLASALGFLLGLLLLNLITRNDFNRLDHLAINVRHGFWFPVGIVVGMAISSQYRLSRRSPTQNSFSELKEYAMATSFGGIIAMGLSYLAHRYGRVEIQVPTQIIVGVVMTSFVVALYRSLLRAAVMSRRPVRVAVIDDGSTYQRIATHLHLQRGIALFGRISLSRDPDPDTIGSIYDIEAIVTEYGLDRVIFGSINELNSEIAYWYRRTTQLVDTALVPRMFEVISWRSRLTDLSGLPLLEMAPRNVSRFDHFMKRTFDVIIALVALILTIPLALIIAVAIKVTSRGPVLFRQERLGRHRKPFTILKFRTMRLESHDTPLPEGTSSADVPLYVSRGKLHESNRRTAIGGLLRRTGLDEIPQFLNVLFGSMSIVGPRPFIVSESDIEDPHYARRFDVRPGITGLWQVSGRNDLTAEELRQLDYLYVTAWALWWDIKICVDTPRAMLRGLGAY